MVLLPLNVVIRDAADNAIGGLWCHTAFGWLSIELLYVPDTLRKQGIGRNILIASEAEAGSRKCHSARLNTHEFQSAKVFYEKCGYEQFGEIADYPIGYPRYFMKKSLLI